MKTLDTRDLYKRKCELEELQYTFNNAKEELEIYRDANNRNTFEEDGKLDEWWTEIERLADVRDSAERDFGTDEKEELAQLQTLENELSFTTFRDGETLIPESDFEEYAREIAEDISGYDGNAGWPYNCIDWEKAAEELQQDYTSVSYQGDTYLVRV